MAKWKKWSLEDLRGAHATSEEKDIFKRDLRKLVMKGFSPTEGDTHESGDVPMNISEIAKGMDGESYFLLHTLTGRYDHAHYKCLSRNPALAGVDLFGESGVKMDVFLNGPNDIAAIEERLGFKDREVMCTISSVRLASAYRMLIGLVLSGEVRVCYDNDSGLYLDGDTGIYTGELLDIAKESSLSELVEMYSERFAGRRGIWGEVILKPPITIQGFFCVSADDKLLNGEPPAFKKERQVFVEKCRELRLPMLEISFS